MYYQSYEDYIRNILGYPVSQDMCTNTYSNNVSNQNNEFFMQTPMYSNEIMNLYPEIYKILYPMVCKICEANTKPITKELIDAMTEEIYMNIESDPSVVDTINIRVNVLEKDEKKDNNKEKNAVQSRIQGKIGGNLVSNTGTVNRNNEKYFKQEQIDKSLNKQNISENTKNDEIQENREIKQTIKNNTLQDLIKILILNQLLGINKRPNMPRPQYQNYTGLGPNNRGLFPREIGMAPSRKFY